MGLLGGVQAGYKVQRPGGYLGGLVGVVTRLMGRARKLDGCGQKDRLVGLRGLVGVVRRVSG